MSGKLLLDTNAVIALFENNHQVKSHIVNSTKVFLPSVALGELFYGAFNSKHVEQNLLKITDFCTTLTVLPCDVAVAHRDGQLKKGLRDKGKPIPENDIWIAATAIENELELLSNDQHFENLDQLVQKSW